MLPPHIIICDEVLPHVRKILARELYASGLSQADVSVKLGTSQAMVSKYLNDKESANPPIDPMVQRMARELLASALSGEGPSELTDRFCRLADTCMAEGMLTERYRERFGTEPPACCYGPAGRSTERARVLDDLTKAIAFLRIRPVPDLVPAVKLNIASALQGARTKEQVASFPNRVPDHNGCIGEPRPPEFGASKHLSSVLLAAISRGGGPASVMNTRSGPDVIAALRSMGVEPLVLDRSKGSIEGLLSDGPIGPSRYVADPGDFGIEPCLYIFGRSPLEVVHMAYELQQRLSSNTGRETK